MRYRNRNAEIKQRYARVAQLVEHDLAKVGAAGSSPVSRSQKLSRDAEFFVFSE